MRLLALALAIVLQAELVLVHGAWSPLAALGVLAAAWRPPIAVIGLSLGATADHLISGVELADRGLVFLALTITCALTGRYARGAWLATPALAVATVTIANQHDSDVYSAADDLVWASLMLGTPALLGWMLQRRAATIAELEAREAELREAREREAEAATLEERARLAVAVHDALAHRLGDMAIQAAGAERLAPVEPQRALSAVARIEGAARDALDEIRRAVGVLRHGDDLAIGAPRMASLPAAPEPLRRSVPAPGASHLSSLDPLIAATMFVALAVEASTSSRSEGTAIANLACLAAIAVPLVWRRRAPLPSAAALFVACAAQTLFLTPLDYLVTPVALILLPAYSVAAHLPLRGAIAGLVLCVVGSLSMGPSVLTGLVAAAARGGGRAVRDRGRRLRELHGITAALELARDAEATRARSEERLRVARELHDALAHRLTVIVLQAEAAQRVWDARPDDAREAVVALAQVARETLSDLRVALDAEDDVGSIEDLVAQVRRLGVEVNVSGENGDEVAFRVVREALTNAVRHAAPTRVDVQLRPDRVIVTDTGGPGTGVPGAGTGLRGLAERLAARGGELRHGPSGGGYRVEAIL